MIKKTIEKIINQKITIWQWITGFVGVLFIRYILENISSSNHLGVITADASTIIHYSLFYLGLLLSLVLILKIFLPLKITAISKIALFALPIIWLPPLFDLLLTWGQGWDMAYHFAYFPDVFYDWLTFFGSFDSGITPGIRLEVILLLIGISLLIFTYTKNVIKTILGLITCYSVFFIWLAAPSILYIFSDLLSNNKENIFEFLTSRVRDSILNTNLSDPSSSYLNPTRLKEIQFNHALIQIYTIAISLLLAAWAYLWDSKIFISILKNSRFRRNLFYLSFVIIGIFLATRQGNFSWSWNFFDISSIICALIAYYGAWMFSVGINDIIDKPIDNITNRLRPLITGEINTEEMKNSNILFLLLALVAAYAVSPYMLFFVTVFIASYYIYSSPPLKLKKRPGVATLLISLIALSVTMSSFFMISPDKDIRAFPVSSIVIIILTVSLIANIKDIKDYQGDKQNGIKTMPVIFGLKKGKFIISLMTFFSFFLTPIISERWWLLLPAVILAPLTYWLINIKKYKEKNLFYIFFVYIIIILLWY